MFFLNALDAVTQHRELYDIESYSKSIFEIFGRPIAWYGIFIATGALLAFFIGKHIAGKKFGIPENVVFDGFIMGLLLGVLGARLWYVALKLDIYLQDPVRIITEFGQGLAIHGAVFFAGAFVIYYCWKKKLNGFQVGELVASGFFIGQIFGRWGNFFNKEAHGGLIVGYPDFEAQRVWLQSRLIPDFIVNQMFMYGNDLDSVTTPYAGYYHPTFLYESLWNMVGLGIVLALRRFCKKYWIGDGVSFYLVWYSIGRFWIESMRTDPLTIGNIRFAQLTSIVLLMVGVATFVLRRIYKIYPFSYKEFQAPIDATPKKAKK